MTFILVIHDTSFYFFRYNKISTLFSFISLPPQLQHGHTQLALYLLLLPVIKEHQFLLITFSSLPNFSYTVCTLSIPEGGWGRLRHGLNQLPLSGAEFKERVELHLYSSSVFFFWRVTGRTLTLFYFS